jgi:hypothetical protein
MDEKSKLIARLDELARQASSPEPNTRSADVIAIDQIAVFGRLLVVLGQDLNKAQKKIEYLTWAIAILTAVIAVLTAVLVFDVFQSDDSDTGSTNIVGALPAATSDKPRASPKLRLTKERSSADQADGIGVR